jgi:D-glycero-alpha-D-manno-heptose 1-phosphate guanylyltransferase
MVVLCGGRGQRLGSLTAVVPKPLLPVGDGPFLLRLLLQWKAEGVRRFILATHHLAEQFHEFARQYQGEVGELVIAAEASPLGTGGGLKNAAAQVKTCSFFAANGDSYVAQPLRNVFKTHRERKLPTSLVAIPPDQVLGGARQKGRLVVDDDARLASFSTEANVQDGLVNAGLYVLDRSEMKRWPEGAYDLESAILPNRNDSTVGVFKSTGRLLDIGTPPCYLAAREGLGPAINLFSGLDKLRITA